MNVILAAIFLWFLIYVAQTILVQVSTHKQIGHDNEFEQIIPGNKKTDHKYCPCIIKHKNLM